MNGLIEQTTIAQANKRSRLQWPNTTLRHLERAFRVVGSFTSCLDMLMMIAKHMMTPILPSGLVGSLHTPINSAEVVSFDSCQRISILASVAGSVKTRISKTQPSVDEL